MAAPFDDIKLTELRQLKPTLICQKCKKYPRIGTHLYRCSGTPCQALVCYPCVRAYNTNYNYCPIGNISGGTHSGTHYIVYKDVIASKLVQIFTYHPCLYSANGCKEEVHEEKLKSHEDCCIYQKVPCPLITCKDNVIYNDVDKHVNDGHANSKHDKQQEFEGKPDELINKVITIKAYDQLFFAQFHKIDDNLNMRVVMLGHPEENLPFKMVFKCQLEQNSHLEWQRNVYPIKFNTKTNLDARDKFTVLSISDLTEYYDFEAKMYKNSPNIKFCLKIVNDKLDQAAKDLELESGISDNDFDDESSDKASIKKPTRALGRTHTLKNM